MEVLANHQTTSAPAPWPLPPRSPAIVVRPRRCRAHRSRAHRPGWPSRRRAIPPGARRSGPAPAPSSLPGEVGFAATAGLSPACGAAGPPGAPPPRARRRRCARTSDRRRERVPARSWTPGSPGSRNGESGTIRAARANWRPVHYDVSGRLPQAALHDEDGAGGPLHHWRDTLPAIFRRADRARRIRPRWRRGRIAQPRAAPRSAACKGSGRAPPATADGATKRARSHALRRTLRSARAVGDTPARSARHHEPPRRPARARESARRHPRGTSEAEPRADHHLEPEALAILHPRGGDARVGLDFDADASSIHQRKSFVRARALRRCARAALRQEVRRRLLAGYRPRPASTGSR